MRRRRTATAIAAALALPVAVACEQALSIDGTVTVAPHVACGLPVAAGTCEQCVASSCCAQASACAGDPTCVGYESCLLGCGSDYTCRTACAIDNGGGGAAEIPALDQCVATSCNDACGMTCGITAAPTYVDAAVTCETCIAARACGASLACATDRECELIEHCFVGCVTPDCHDACLALDDAGSLATLETALVSYCIKPCQLGNFWQCVGGISWPTAPAGASDVTVVVTDSTTLTPLPGLVVKACDSSDETCATPFSSGTTDATGSVTLALRNQPESTFGFGGYFDLVTADGFHELYFVSAPLTLSHATVRWDALSLVGFDDLASQAEVTLDPTRGHVAVEANDCLLAPASGVAFTATGTDSATQLFYYSDGMLLGDVAGTDITGLAFFLDVPIGSVTVQAIPAALGKVSSTVTAFTRPGALSVVTALPTP
jgi:hypothetical protein